MGTYSSSRKRTRDLVAYFSLAYAFSWLVGIPLALSNQGVIEPFLPQWTHYLFAYGPMLAALVVTGLSEGREGLRDIGSRMILWKVRPIWWIVALSPLLIGHMGSERRLGGGATRFPVSNPGGAPSWQPPSYGSFGLHGISRCSSTCSIPA
jgi:hypothetical protein